MVDTASDAVGNSVAPNLSDTLGFVPETDNLPIVTCSSRRVRTPSYLQDYHCGLVSHDSSSSIAKMSTAHPLSQVFNYDRLSCHFKALVLAVSGVFKPSSYF